MREFIINRINNNQVYPNYDLKYILLLGDENSIPPDYYSNIPFDDYFILADPNVLTTQQIPIGRIPVSSINDAEKIVEQIRDYILNPIGGKLEK